MSAPYMPLFVADYLADTAHLSAAENGAYLLLIMNYWQRQKPLPGDDRKLARICKLTDDEWAEARDTIAEFFIEDDGEWRHKRIEHEIAVAEEKSAKAKASARASANARKAKSGPDAETNEANAERTLSDRSANSELLGEDREDTTVEAHASPVEGARKTRPPPTSRATRIPDDFEFDEATRAVGRAEGLTDGQIDRQQSQFLDWGRSVSGERGLKRDWQATGRNWLRKSAQGFGQTGSHVASGNGSPSGGRLGAYQRAADRFRASDDDPERRADVFGGHRH